MYAQVARLGAQALCTPVPIGDFRVDLSRLF